MGIKMLINESFLLFAFNYVVFNINVLSKTANF